MTDMEFPGIVAKVEILEKSDIPYPYVRAWYYGTGSFPQWVSLMVHTAKKDGAPRDAIYKDQNGRWHTFLDIQSEGTVRELVRVHLPKTGEHIRVYLTNDNTICDPAYG